MQARVFLLAAAAASALAGVARADVVTQSSTDVQALQAWRADAYQLDPQRCVGPAPAPGQRVDQDCAAQGAELARAPWADRASPSVNDWRLPVENHNGYVYSRYASGHLVELRVLVKRAALDAPSFTGVGFYASNALGSGLRFVPKAALHVVSPKDVTLASGEPAAVLRFVLAMPGESGDSSTGWAMASVAFKPYVEFQDGATTYRNWEPVSDDFRVYREPNGGGRHQSTSFDRQAELLRP
jgi:hypothetical protein